MAIKLQTAGPVTKLAAVDLFPSTKSNKILPSARTSARTDSCSHHKLHRMITVAWNLSEVGMVLQMLYSTAGWTSVLHPI